MARRQAQAVQADAGPAADANEAATPVPAEDIPKAEGGQGSSNPFKHNPYFGLMSMLAWFYCFWFVSDAFRETDLLDWTVTFSWIVFLPATTVTLLAVSALLARNQSLDLKHCYLSDVHWLDAAVAGTLSLGGLLLHLRPDGTPDWMLAYVLPIMLGMAYAVMWILWGERYARLTVPYSAFKVSVAYVSVVLASLAVAYALPPIANSVAIALIPLATLWSMRRKSGADHGEYPKMLPKKTRDAVRPNLAVVCGAVAATSALSYFTLAIIPLWDLPFGNDSFTLGVVVGAIGMALVGFLAKQQPERFTIFRMFPWMLVFTVAASLLYLSGNVAYFPWGFVLSLTLSSMYAIMLIMYSGILVKKGYLRPATAFALCGACVYGGIFVGNGTAIFFEHNLQLEPMFLQPVTIALILLVAFSIIPFMRQESRIEELMAPVEKASDLKDMVQATAEEFGLSPRETEILELLARGFNTERVARELVISNYTVQTHIQHIYTKTGIHRRSDLMDYLNKRD